MNTPPTSKLRKLSLPRRATVSAQDNEDSPTYIPDTQESLEGIDVGWDWNSPQSTQRKHKKVKKCLIQSPQLPIKRCLSVTHQQQQQQNTQLVKLHEELKALQRQLAQPDDEDCLCVSPQQEQEFKTILLDNDDDRIFTEFDDIFNDSVDEQLLLCSQKFETTVIDNHEQQQQQQKIDFCNNHLIKQEEFNDDDDKWDDIFNSIENKNFIKEYQQTKTLKQRTKSEEQFTTSGKVGFQRTKSFDIETTSQEQKPTTATSTLSKSMLDEIERKRREARLKLEAKRKQEPNKRASPNKCTDQEIEKKRLEAKAKLEAKRLQEIVERNRQEALKRLQMNRQKNVTQFKRL